MPRAIALQLTTYCFAAWSKSSCYTINGHFVPNNDFINSYCVKQNSDNPARATWFGDMSIVAQFQKPVFCILYGGLKGSLVAAGHLTNRKLQRTMHKASLVLYMPVLWYARCQIRSRSKHWDLLTEIQVKVLYRCKSICVV